MYFGIFEYLANSYGFYSVFWVSAVYNVTASIRVDSCDGVCFFVWFNSGWVCWSDDHYHICIQGGVPPTLLQVGSPQDVEEHCKNLIKTVGKNGGFILGPGSVIDYAKPENVKAMVDSAKKYGWY